MVDKVAYLRNRTRKSTTAIVVESINRYHAEVTQRGETPAEILARSGFIGCARGPENLSRNYKMELRRSLRQKT